MIVKAGIFVIFGRKILWGTGSWGWIFCWILRRGGALMGGNRGQDIHHGDRGGRREKIFFNAKARSREEEAVFF